MEIVWSPTTVKGSEIETKDYLRKIPRKIEEISDSLLRNALRDEVDFFGVKPYGPAVPAACGYSKYQNTEYYLVLGTNDQMFKRICSAYHSSCPNIVFIVQSVKQAWFRENKNKEQKKKSDGNRANFGKFMKLMDIFQGWNDWSDNVTVVEISTKSGDSAYASYFN
jgi:hypothetical protein